MKKMLALFLSLVLTVTAVSFAAAETARTPLTDLEPFEKEYMDLDPYTNECQDPFGNVYNSCLGPREDEGYVEFYLNGQYDRLIGTLYATGKNLDTTYDYNWDFATCTIYGDDCLLFTHTGFHRKDDPIPFELDVRGVRFLRITFEKDAYFNTGCGRPLVLLGDLFLETENP